MAGKKGPLSHACGLAILLQNTPTSALSTHLERTLDRKSERTLDASVKLLGCLRLGSCRDFLRIRRCRQGDFEVGRGRAILGLSWGWALESLRHSGHTLRCWILSLACPSTVSPNNLLQLATCTSVRFSQNVGAAKNAALQTQTN